MSRAPAISFTILLFCGCSEVQNPKSDAVKQVSPDFSGTIFTPKMSHVSGTRPVLAILWDPKRADHPAPKAEDIDRMLFGAKPSVADWFSENSGGKFTIERAGCVGWFDADKPAEHYWGNDPEDSDGDGFVTGHVEKWTEAIRKADKDFNFARYDTNNDGVVQSGELGILVVIPQNEPFGTVRGLAGQEKPEWKPLVVDEVQIPEVSEWYCGNPPNFGAPAHELSHLLLGAPDLYIPGPWPFGCGSFSLMDCSYGTTHLDPFEKLKLGWLNVTVVSSSGEYKLRDVESTCDALILYDPKPGRGEYFIIENRLRGKSYDAGVNGVGGLAADGLAIWHILEDPALIAKSEAPGTAPDEWGRRGIRMIRRNGGNPFDDSKALYSTAGETVNLSWLNGKPAGISVRAVSIVAREVTLQVSIPLE